MPYADTDFFIALLKESDWLSKKAERILAENKGSLWTSNWTLVETLLLCQEFGLDPEIVTLSIAELARVEGDMNQILMAAHMMKKFKMKTFDALHAASCGSDTIISSDSIFEKAGLKRIPLEK